ncbi:hypothetical protein [Mesorhizobium sp. M4B.F.Ca.ET.058.02.1.1]|uniref:hypothetical protein n=1 Tax=Mesorhizobium sp. M4B.F.Ca.ET.058.02.1.1 TaxID=2493675 RepID=UPI00167D0AC4|nr:hypothetical protein [Mesorhizobium sp. M4B.F.Ca.ET.058.02.1.1]
MVTRPTQKMVDEATLALFNHNSDQALQSSIELQLVTRPTKEVVKNLRAWADYLEERS